MNLIMDNFVDNKERKNNSKYELCLFRSTSASFESSLCTKKNIRKLVIIGQETDSFNAVTELDQIQELWIVECGIKEIPHFKENCMLEKLYLFSNEIFYIPSFLETCSHLKVLFLSGNNISDLENFNKLTELEELNLADNKLERIDKISLKKSKLRYLNLAGNHLCFIKDIRNLSELQNLESLVFADLLYGDCPIVTLCNYRVYVIHQIPHINKLDHYFIQEKERHLIEEFFKKQITYYNTLLHKQLNERLNILKHDYKQYEKQMLYYRHQIYATKYCSKNKTDEESQNVILKMELSTQQLIERKRMAIAKLKILNQQLIVNMDYCGNINFVEYNATPENTVIELCKQFLEESLCSIIKHNVGIAGLKIFKVTKVSNKELNQLSVGKNENSQLAPQDIIFKILYSPGVQDIENWPFEFFKNSLFTQQELVVTNCLAVADAKWLNETFRIKTDKNELNMFNSCQGRRVCVLLQTPIFNDVEKTDNAVDYLHMKYKNNWNDEREACQIFKLTHSDIRNPMFVIEYEYISRELKKGNKYKNPIDKYMLNPSTCVHISNSNIAFYIDMNERVDLYHLVNICLSGKNIVSLDVDLELPNLKEFDISYNQLQEFPNLNIIKNVKVLNISFNNIKSIHIEKVFPMLESLNVSWNCLLNYFMTIENIAAFLPNIRKLMISNNPVKDVLDPESQNYITLIYLPNLQYINNYLCKNLSMCQNYFPCAFNMCKSTTDHKLLCLTRNMVQNEGKIIAMETKNVERAKYVHVSQNFKAVSKILKTLLKVQAFCATCCFLTIFPIKKSLNHLTKLNLGSNFISNLDNFTQENLPSLKYLDLTNNLITSLEPMGSFAILQQFYCGNNEIRNIVHIDNVKSWHMLEIIDLSNNPISADALYKNFIIFHLSNIKYISGEHVQNSDISEARHVFGNKLDKYVLNTVYTMDRLTNITQLSLIDCALSKVDLSADFIPNLESLDLSKNQINYLRGLHSLRDLHTLCLSYNCLETFDERNCEGDEYAFPKLCTLFLDHNYIKSFADIIKQLPIIKHLFLNNNCLRNVNGINHCTTLESLCLDCNEIETLNAEEEFTTNNLKFLSLENNKIKSLAFLKSLQKLEKLYVANNCLKDESEMQYLLLLTNLEELTFDHNPLYTETNKDKVIAQEFEVKNIEMDDV